MTLKGTWTTVIVDGNSKAFLDIEVARAQCDPDEYLSVLIVRESALPMQRIDGQGPYLFPRDAEDYDIALSSDSLTFADGQVDLVFTRAQAMAAGLNAASV